MSTLKHRIHQSEQLDNLSLNGTALSDTLDELTRINRLIGNTAAVCKAVLRMIPKNSPSPIRITDLGCGGGDILIAVANYLHTHKVPATFLGLEGNPHSVAYAQKQAATLPSVRFQTAEILSPSFQCPDCDIVISSHFLYHFSDEALGNFLQDNRSHVRIGWIISELQRSVLSYRMFQLLSPFLGLNPISRADGLLAIRRAFHRRDLESIFSTANIHTYSIKWLWSFRYLITLEPNAKFI